MNAREISGTPKMVRALSLALLVALRVLWDGRCGSLECQGLSFIQLLCGLTPPLNGSCSSPREEIIGEYRELKGWTLIIGFQSGLKGLSFSNELLTIKVTEWDGIDMEWSRLMFWLASNAAALLSQFKSFCACPHPWCGYCCFSFNLLEIKWKS